MIDENIKKWIDNASYEELLRKWRTAALGDPHFQRETGAYYRKVMKEKRKEIGPGGHAAASKRIG